MVTFEEIDGILQKYTIDSIYDNYEKRQDSNTLANRKKILELNQDFYGDSYHKIKHVNPYVSFMNFLSTIGGKCPERKETLKRFLLEQHYNLSFELVQAMHLFDLTLNDELNKERFLYYFGGLFSINGFKEFNEDYWFYFSNLGDCPIYPAYPLLGHDTPPKSKRRNNCHSVTAKELLVSPNLYGAYYYIPYQFYGYVEHSVIIDEDKDMIYDLSQNLAISLTIWQKYYPNPSFSIQGGNFKALSEQVFEKYEHQINMCFLEEMRRMRKK